LWRITHGMLRWMAPFLSFTAEEAWGTFGTSESIFLETFSNFGAADEQLLAKWARIREIRDLVNKDIENLRADGQVGASLQAEISLTAPAADHALLASLGADIKFVFITSKVELSEGPELHFAVGSASATGVQKCERCWHYPDFPNQVGKDPDHPALCGRCISNLHGAGEVRHFA
jgi:isoleucyl-tRNA synthetase